MKTLLCLSALTLSGCTAEQSAAIGNALDQGLAGLGQYATGYANASQDYQVTHPHGTATAYVPGNVYTGQWPQTILINY